MKYLEEWKLDFSHDLICICDETAYKGMSNMRKQIHNPYCNLIGHTAFGQKSQLQMRFFSRLRWAIDKLARAIDVS